MMYLATIQTGFLLGIGAYGAYLALSGAFRVYRALQVRFSRWRDRRGQTAHLR